MDTRRYLQKLTLWFISLIAYHSQLRQYRPRGQVVENVRQTQHIGCPILTQDTEQVDYVQGVKPYKIIYILIPTTLVGGSIQFFLGVNKILPHHMVISINNLK